MGFTHRDVAEPAWCIHNACDYKVGSRHEREQGMAGSALVRDLCDKLHQALSPDKRAVILCNPTYQVHKFACNEDNFYYDHFYSILCP